jgi:hypothetical protein
MLPDDVAHPPSTAMAGEAADHTSEAPFAQLREPPERCTIRKVQIDCSQAQQERSPMDQPAGPPVKSTSLIRFLQTYAEPYTISTQRALLYKTNFISFAVRYGPLVMRRFSREQDEIYEISPSCQHGFSIAIQLSWYFLGKMMLNVFAWREVSRFRGLSLQWNLSFPRVVPISAPIMDLARTGDIAGMEILFSAGEASPADVRSDGTSLLHVRSLLTSGSSVLD